MINMVVSDSDSESYTESSDNEDQYDSKSAYGGHAQSILSSLDESIEKIDDFLAFGRRFTHGDIVHSVTSPSGQMGRVVDVDMTVDLETSYGELIKDINSKNLLRLLSLASGDYVICGAWLGRVRKVFDLVTILFSDGAKCEIMTGDPEIRMHIPPNLNDEAPYPYYPGQHVKTKLPAFSKSIRWLCGSWKANRDEGTVCHVEVGLVDVNWIASITVCQGSSAPIPHLQDPKKLTLLSCFPCSNWQIGDWCTLPNDYFREVLMSSKESRALGFTPQRLVQVQKELGRKNEVCKEICVIAKMKTKVDVVWQNGLVSTGIDSNTLSPVAHVSDHDFWPEQFVLEKVISEDVVVPGGQRLGIVKKVNAQEQTVEVKWICPDNEKTVASIGASNEEIVSAYQLIEHPDFSYSVGDIVFRLLPHLARFEENLHHAPTDGEYQDLPVKGVNSAVLLGQVVLEKLIHEGQDEYAAGYLSHIGNVIALKDEGFEVKWASGLISKVHPSEIIGVDRLDDPASATVVSEVANLESVGNGIPRQETQYWQENKKAVNDSSDDYKTFMWSTNALTVSKTAIGFLTNVAASLFGLFGSTSQSGSSKPTYLHCLEDLGLLMPPLDPTTEICSVQSEGSCKLQYLETGKSESELDDVVPEDLKQKGEVAKQDEQAKFSTGKEKSVQFKQFDIVDDYSDHQLVNCVGKGLASSLVRRGWLNKVQQEWSILKNNLPDDIYVRVYEERIDLLRASIIGAPGTPYHNGLFFFDILLPPGYPIEPPMVHYNSGGLRLNPNLYESGKVCLSLLKTWTGTGTEVWNPENSTILQVLLSLQALVLNDKPYFNEAGYDKQLGRAEGERNSTNYNENAFLVTCRMMLYHLRKPPKHFEALVEDHFAQRAHSILLTCNAYMDGVQVGCAFKGGSEGQRSSSSGFKIMVAKLYPMLISGFIEKGIDCSQFISQANLLPYTGKDLDLT